MGNSNSPVIKRKLISDTSIPADKVSTWVIPVSSIPARDKLAEKLENAGWPFKYKTLRYDKGIDITVFFIEVSRETMTIIFDTYPNEILIAKQKRESDPVDSSMVD